MKRFTDTDKWKDPWFQDLPCKFKLLWSYLADNCDCAGVWKVNLRLAAFQIGNEYLSPECLDAFKDRIEDLGGERWWIKEFCRFQYGPLQLDCKQHLNIYNCLNSHGLASRVEIREGPRVGTTPKERNGKERKRKLTPDDLRIRLKAVFNRIEQLESGARTPEEDMELGLQRAEVTRLSKEIQAAA